MLYFLFLQSRVMRAWYHSQKKRDSFIMFLFALQLYAFAIMLVDNGLVKASLPLILAPALILLLLVSILGGVMKVF